MSAELERALAKERKKVSELEMKVMMMEMQMKLMGLLTNGDLVPYTDLIFIRALDKKYDTYFGMGSYHYVKNPNSIMDFRTDLSEEEQKELEGILTATDDPKVPDRFLHPNTLNARQVRKDLKEGDRVLVSEDKKLMVRLTLDDPLITGFWGTLKKEIRPGIWIAKMMDLNNRDEPTNPTVYIPTELRSQAEENARVLCDASNRYVYYIEPQPKKAKHKDYDKYLVAQTGVTWDDVGGYDEVKTWVKTNLELPMMHRDLYETYGLGMPKGFLLAGPPGNGKTLILKAIATDLAGKHKRPGLFLISGPELLNLYVGETERMIRGVFAAAEEFFRENGYPAIIGIDEAESLLSKRGSGVSSDIDKTIVPTFLTCMDGVRGTSAVVALITNRPDMLDPAVTREGRCDRKLEIGRPDRVTADAVLQVHMRGKPLGEPEPDLRSYALDSLFSDKLVVKEVLDTTGKAHKLLLSNVLSGALIASVVKEAGRAALVRDAAQGKKKPTGITKQDLKDSVLQHLTSNTKLDHKLDVEAMAQAIGFTVAEVRAVTYV